MAESNVSRPDDATPAGADLRESDRQFRLLVNSVHNHAIFVIDPDGIVVSWNAGAQRIKGYTADEIIGKHFSKFYSDNDILAGLPMRSLEIAAKQGRFQAEAIRIRKDGTSFWANVLIEPIRDEAGRLVAFAKITHDITERRQSREHLYRLAHFDSLTGIRNRFAFRDALEMLADGETSVAVLMLDIDRFKDINDAFGHAGGDFILAATAQRLVACVGDNGIVGRLGGDEFGILHSEVGEPIALARLCHQIMTAMEESFLFQGHDIQARLSIGSTIGPTQGASADELLNNADIALRRIRSEGRSGHLLFQPAFRHELQAQTRCERELRRAAADKEFELFYQPIIDLDDRSVAKAEALLRWKHPERGILAPGAFMHVLERGPLASAVGDWTIRTACAFAASVRKSASKDFCVSVNLFGAQFQSGRLVSTVRNALDDFELPASALELEITENIVLRHDDEMIVPLRELRNIGVGIAFDDFGTGYASLALLKRFPLTTIKIDQLFVRKIDADVRDRAVVRAILALGAEFGLRVVVEGVETEPQETILRGMGCSIAQGYLYGRPTSGNVLLERLSGRAAAAGRA